MVLLVIILTSPTQMFKQNNMPTTNTNMANYPNKGVVNYLIENCKLDLFITNIFFIFDETQ